MIRLSRQQIETFRRTQLDRFAADAQLFLHQYFEPRLRSCSSADLRDAVLLAHVIGREHDLTRRGELLIYLACACVCGLFLFDDPRCLWLFREEPTPESIESATNFSIDTFAQNLDANPASGFFDEDPLMGFQDTVLAAEGHLLRSSVEMKRALLSMTPAREWFVETPHFAQFMNIARDMGQRQRLGAHALTRYILLAWLFGVRFLDDPLCRPAIAFLRAATQSPAVRGTHE